MIKEISAYLQVFRSQKMAALLFLGFASGLPLFLTSRTLQAWMTTEGVDLKSIGLFSLVTLPYSLKFLWSPLLDRYVPPFLGRRRGWILIAQICLTLAIGFMAFQQPKQSLELLAINALLIAFFSARGSDRGFRLSFGFNFNRFDRFNFSRSLSLASRLSFPGWIDGFNDYLVFFRPGYSP